MIMIRDISEYIELMQHQFQCHWTLTGSTWGSGPLLCMTRVLALLYKSLQKLCTVKYHNII
jgi:hypothetical protein